jgi:hypothetical protein
MPEPSPVAAPLPRSVRWFAPWTWSRKTLWALIPVILAAYVLSQAPVKFFLVRTGMFLSVPLSMPIYEKVFAPVEWCAVRSPALRKVRDAETVMLRKCFGTYGKDGRLPPPARKRIP